MSALYPTLLTIWLPVLIGVPVLIHLINLMRHRRVRWAAMAFLLESQKKNQNWIRFKEILLLITRMAAIAAVVLMLAGLLLSDRFSRLFSGGLVHHVVLVDDSLSMSDQWDNTTAIQNARGVVEHLLDRAAHHPGTHLITLLKFSDTAAGRGPDVIRQPIKAGEPQQRQKLLEHIQASQQAAGPLDALKAVKEKVGQLKDENLVVYLVSDFRSRQWQDAKTLTDAIRDLTNEQAKVQLVRCVDRARPNLAITALTPDAGIRAADVPLRMEVAVTNYDSAPARNVQVLLECQTNAGDSAAATRQGLPAVTIDRIDPGQTVRQFFSARFPTAGDHEIYARLGSDALTADNERFCIIPHPAEVPLLIVDGKPGSVDAQLLARPRSGVRTGLKSQIVGTSYLREQPLDKFAEVVLVNIASLDAAEVAALERYVSGGGSVVFFAGENTRAEFVNESLYRDGKGFFPLPLVSPASLVVDRLDQAPDMDIDLTHPIFRRTFAGSRHAMLNSLFVERYFAAPKDWSPAAKGGVRVLATLRNKAPLIVERKYGQGVCIALLTTASTEWNNLASTFLGVIALQDMHAYLTTDRFAQPAHQVGQPLKIDLDKNKYTAEVQFTRPDKKTPQRESLRAIPVAGSEMMQATLNKTDERGVYEAKLAPAEGPAETRLFAVNIPSGEGDLAILSSNELQTALADVPAVIHEASDFSGSVTQQAGLNLGTHWLFFAIVIALLMGEQLLAYSASYHPAPTQGRR